MRKIAVILLLTVITATLSGCVYGFTSVHIYPDGSGKTTAELGFSKRILDQLGRKLNEFTSKYNESYITKIGDYEYETEMYGDAFINPEEINWSAGVGSLISKELGPVKLHVVDGGFRLSVKLFDQYCPNMKPNIILPKDVKSITEESITGMTLVDLVAQDADDLSLNAEFHMPYGVKQVAGVKNGVSIQGKTVTLNYLEMIKSGCKEWAFESVKSVNQNVFMDVKPDAWYAKAVNYVADGGMVNGFGDGKFYPDGQLTLAQLCKIIYVGLGGDVHNDPQYWAKKYVENAVHIGYILDEKPIVKGNWDVPATREQAVYAITLAARRQMSFKKINSEEVKDFNSIDERMRDVILWAYGIEAINGRPDGTFGPKETITRAELCQLLYNIHWTVPKSDIRKNS